MPIDTRLKNTASKARSLLTGLSKANKISSRATAQISKKQFGSDMEAPQQLVRHDVDGCGRCVARYDQPVPDECLTEEAHDNDDQVQHAADSCVKLWRLFNRTSCHFGSPLGWRSHVSKTAKRGAPRSRNVLLLPWRPFIARYDHHSAAALACSFHRCSFTPNTSSHTISDPAPRRPKAAR